MKEPMSGSFNEMVDAFAKIVLKNPSIAQKNGWPTERSMQELFVDEREARRLVAHGWTQFVNLESSVSVSEFTIPDSGSKKNWPRAAVGGAKAAADAYASLFKDGPVERSLAEDRATICSQCPKNNTKTSLASIFTTAAASAVTSLIGMVRDMSLTTSMDNHLGICDACLCPMKAKVHVKIGTLTGAMPNDVWPKLERTKVKCWILSESGRN